MSFVHSHPIWSLAAALAGSQLVVLGLLGMCAAGKREEEITVTVNRESPRDHSTVEPPRQVANQ